MKKLRRILVDVAELGTAHVAVLRRAAALALASGATLELLHVQTEPAMQKRRVAGKLVLLPMTGEASAAVARQALEKIAASKLLQGCRIRTTVVSDKPAYAAIARHAIASRADLVINGTRSRRLADRLILRHTDWELIRHCPVPLLLVKSVRAARRAVTLAAIDPMHANAKPSQLDGRILDIAGGISALLEAELHAFHAYMPLSVMLAANARGPVISNTVELDQQYARRVRRDFVRELRRTSIASTRQHLRLGAPALELAACAARIRATLVVMGAVSRSRLGRIFIGSTAERALDDLACDVLIVKPSGFKNPQTAAKGG